MRKLREEDRIFIKNSGVIEFVQIREITAITSIGNYCRIILSEGKEVLIRKTLTSCEETLPETLFLRISRSIIINLNSITKISQWSSGTYRIHLKNINEPFTLSQRYTYKVRDKLKF